MMTMGDNYLLVDTNILIYALDKDSPFHAKALNALNTALSQNKKLAVTSQILREYFVCVSKVLGSQTAQEHLLEFEKHFTVLFENAHSQAVLWELIHEYEIVGKPIHDANLVSVALACGIKEILTYNTKDFQRFSHKIQISSF